MPTFAVVIAALTTLLTIAGIAYYLIAIVSARAFLRSPRLPHGFAPSVSILKALHGVDAGMSEAFASHCRQNYAGDYELLFAVSNLDDPAAALVRDLETQFPERSSRRQRQSQQSRAAFAARARRIPHHQ
jgi:ceramide glucosyltransferase